MRLQGFFLRGFARCGRGGGPFCRVLIRTVSVVVVVGILGVGTMGRMAQACVMDVTLAAAISASGIDPTQNYFYGFLGPESKFGMDIYNPERWKDPKQGGSQLDGSNHGGYCAGQVVCSTALDTAPMKQYCVEKNISCSQSNCPQVRLTLQSQPGLCVQVTASVLQDLSNKCSGNLTCMVDRYTGPQFSAAEKASYERSVRAAMDAAMAGCTLAEGETTRFAEGGLIIIAGENGTIEQNCDVVRLPESIAGDPKKLYDLLSRFTSDLLQAHESLRTIRLNWAGKYQEQNDKQTCWKAYADIAKVVAALLSPVNMYLELIEAFIVQLLDYVCPYIVGAINNFLSQACLRWPPKLPSTSFPELPKMETKACDGVSLNDMLWYSPQPLDIATGIVPKTVRAITAGATDATSGLFTPQSLRDAFKRWGTK